MIFIINLLIVEEHSQNSEKHNANIVAQLVVSMEIIVDN
jgi:hypothetical protein